MAKELPRGYWPLLKRAADRDVALQDYYLRTSTPGVSLRADLRESVYMPILRHGCIPHQLTLDKLLRAVLRPGDVVVDVGANIGYVSLLAADLVGPTGVVLAIEPSTRMSNLLKRSSRAIRQIEVREQALGDAEGEATFYERDSGDISSLLPSSGSTTRYKVQVSTLACLHDEGLTPDLVKIDVEGSEPQVLAGMGPMGSGEQAPVIVFEALGLDALGSCLSVLHGSFESYANVFRLGDGYLSTRLEDETLSHDFVAVPDERFALFTRRLATQNLTVRTG